MMIMGKRIRLKDTKIKPRAIRRTSMVRLSAVKAARLRAVNVKEARWKKAKARLQKYLEWIKGRDEYRRERDEGRITRALTRRRERMFAKEMKAFEKRFVKNYGEMLKELGYMEVKFEHDIKDLLRVKTDIFVRDKEGWCRLEV